MGREMLTLPYNIMGRGFKFWDRMSPIHQLSYELAAATFTSKWSSKQITNTDVKTSEPTNADVSANILFDILESSDFSVELSLQAFVGNMEVHSLTHEGDKIHRGDEGLGVTTFTGVTRIMGMTRFMRVTRVDYTRLCH